jgi:methylmalonyl-CoA mutase C-terminal domain/subunit
MSAWRGRPGPGTRPIRVLLGKVGLDGHDRGVRVVARALRDAGMEVVYTGLHRTPAQVVRIAIEEDVDVIGLSILSGAHMTIFPRLLELLRAEELDDVLVVAGGTFLPEDVAALEAMGVSRAFGVDTPLDEIVGYIREQMRDRILAS